MYMYETYWIETIQYMYIVYFMYTVPDGIVGV